MYIVKDENTLGYTVGEAVFGKTVLFIVMAVDYMKGGEPTMIDRESVAVAGSYRKATKADEERFKVRLGLS